MYKLMLIEDDTQLSTLIKENLERFGYFVYQPKNFINIVDEFIHRYDQHDYLFLFKCASKY